MSDGDGAEIWDDPEVKEWAEGVIENLVPKIRESALTVSIVPQSGTDVKFAVELGFSIMLGKPIILLIAPGMEVPEKLVRIADEIVSLDEPWGQGVPEVVGRRINEAVVRVLGREGEE